MSNFSMSWRQAALVGIAIAAILTSARAIYRDFSDSSPLASQATSSSNTAGLASWLGWMSREPPSAVLDNVLVVPPNYTQLGYTARQLATFMEANQHIARWEEISGGGFILRIRGTNRLTGRPFDGRLQLRPVTGPNQINSQVIGFEGPAVVVEKMAENGVMLSYYSIYEGLAPLVESIHAQAAKQ